MTLNENIKAILIKYFTQFYGKNYKELITEKINSIIPIFYDSVETKRSEMYEKLKEKEIELTFEFLKHHGIEIDENLINKILSNNSFSYIEENQKATEVLEQYFGTYNYQKDASIKNILFAPSDDEYKIDNCIRAFKNFGIEVEPQRFNEWVVSQEAQPTLEKIKNEIEYLQTLDQKYDEFSKQFESTRELINKESQIKSNLIEKYLTPHDKKLLEEFNKKEQFTWSEKYNFFKSLDIFKIIDSSIYTVGIVESFSQKSEDMLNDINTSSYQREKIIEDRIKYFKLIGIYDENIPPEEFIKTEIAKQNEPDKTFIEEIIKNKNMYLEMINEEALLATSTYEENKKLIDSLMLLEDVEFLPSSITSKLIAIIPAAKQIENGPQFVPLLIFSPGATLNGYTDVNFIHEINHIIETSLIGQDNKGNMLYKTGFEYITNDNNEERPYEKLSENINQLIAMEITAMMHNDGVYIFDNPKRSKIQGGTSYEHFNAFTLNFYNTFKENIIESRTSTNLESLYEVVGKENFEELNKIINKYNSMPIMQIIFCIARNETNELTIKRQELINRAREIFEKMLENREAITKK